MTMLGLAREFSVNRPVREQQRMLRDDDHAFLLHLVPRLDHGHYTPIYFAPGGHVYLSYLEHALSRLAVRQWQSLIDVGCGQGRLVAMLHERFPSRTIMGVDPSERAIALARALVPHAKFRVGDITRHGLIDETFDVATCIETLATIEPARLPDFVGALRRLLNDDGTLLVTVPSTNMPPAGARQHFTAASLEAALTTQFRFERMEYLNRRDLLSRLAEKVLFNRYFAVTDKRALQFFYRHYRRHHTVTDERRGERILGIFRAI